MNYIKAKYMKANVMQGRAYTFKTEEDVSHGDILETSDGKKVMVVDEPVDMNWVETYGADKVAVVKKVEPAKEESENK